MVRNPQQSIRLSVYLDSLQSKGRITFTNAEAIEVLGLSRIAFNRSAERLIKKKRLIHPARGFYVIVPAEHILAGAPPTSWFIDELMRFQEQSYYVGVLSAAALHGAAHQSPQEFQVITKSPLRSIQFGRARVRFLTKKRIELTPIQRVRTPFGDIPISTPEATAFDVVQYVKKAGYLSNAATVLIELSEKIDSQKLVTAAEACGEITVAQRVGYLLDTFVSTTITAPLHDWVERKATAFIALRPNWTPPSSNLVERNKKWRLIVNEKVEPDV